MRAGQASVTAQRVAAQRLGFERVPAPFGDAGADERLSRDVAADLAGSPPGPMSRYLAARTVFFDRVVVSALESGTEQVVIVGAGYDGRALRYRTAGVQWYEVDHPATQADKARRLERLGVDVGHIAFVAVDLSVEDVGPALYGAGLDPERPALVLCEGLLVYLERSAVERLLAGLRSAVGSGSRLAVSVSVRVTEPGARARREQFSRRVAAVGEPARTVLEPDEAVGLLAASGWSPAAAGTGRGRSAGLMLADAVPAR